MSEKMTLNDCRISAEEDYLKVPISVLKYIAELEKLTLSPETIEVIRFALHELKCLNVEEMLGITNIDFLKKKNIQQAQAEFEKVYGEQNEQK